MDGDNDDYRVDDHAFIDEPLDDDLSVVSFEGDEDEAEAHNTQISNESKHPFKIIITRYRQPSHQ